MNTRTPLRIACLAIGFLLMAISPALAQVTIPPSNISSASSAVWATKVTDETGTGLMVFNNSPTLITPNLGAAIGTSVTGPTTTDLTLAGGSTGASLVLGQGANGAVTIMPKGSGTLVVGTTASANQLNLVGSSSGALGGASLNIKNGSETIFGIGNQSNVLGGAYDNTATVYFISDLLRIYSGALSANAFTLTKAGNGTFVGNLTASGTGTHTFGTTATVTLAAGKISTNAGSWASASTGQVFYTATGGLNLAGSGSTYDFQLLNKNGDLVVYSPTGTQNAIVAGGLTVSGGKMGVGIAPGTDRMLYVSSASAPITGTTQFGAVINPTFGTGATTAINTVYVTTSTAAAAFTCVTATGLLVDGVSLGAGSAITTQRGIYVSSQGTAGITNAYGIDIAAQSGAATVNVGLRNAGTTQLVGAVALGSSTPQTDTVLSIYNGPSAGATQYGAFIDQLFGSDATTSGKGLVVRAKSAAAAYTMVDMFGVVAASPTVGAGSAVTTNTGLLIQNQGAAGITNAYGIDIAAQSGAATTNVGLRNAGLTLFTNATDATDKDTAAVVLEGGLGVEKSAVFGGTIATAGGSGFSITAVNSVSPTAPNRTLTLNYNGTPYYVAAKTSND